MCCQGNSQWDSNTTCARAYIRYALGLTSCSLYRYLENSLLFEEILSLCRGCQLITCPSCRMSRACPLGLGARDEQRLCSHWSETNRCTLAGSASCRHPPLRYLPLTPKGQGHSLLGMLLCLGIFLYLSTLHTLFKKFFLFAVWFKNWGGRLSVWWPAWCLEWQDVRVLFQQVLEVRRFCPAVLHQRYTKWCQRLPAAWPACYLEARRESQPRSNVFLVMFSPKAAINPLWLRSDGLRTRADEHLYNTSSDEHAMMDTCKPSASSGEDHSRWRNVNKRTEGERDEGRGRVWWGDGGRDTCCEVSSKLWHGRGTWGWGEGL